jgi:hypothetical protein
LYFYWLVCVQSVGNLHSDGCYISYLMEALCRLSRYPSILMMTITII